MKKLFLVSILTALAGCGGGEGGTSSTFLNEAVQYSNTPNATGNNAGSGNASLPSQNNAAVSGVEFLNAAYQDSMSEIALSTLAVQRSTNAHVRRYAQLLIDDHTLMNSRIAQLQATRNVALPTTLSPDQVAIQSRLSSLSGPDFDREYLAHNLAVHEKDMLAFLTQSQSGTDQQTSMLATNELAAIRTHLAMTEELYASIDPEAYLVIAYKHGQAEILWSTLAIEKAAVEAVPPFAQMLVDHHTMMNNEIRQLAEKKGLALPDAPSAVVLAMRDHLAQLSGPDFDKAYMSENVIVHAGDVKATTAQVSNGTDNDVKQLAENALPKLVSHLKMAGELYLSIDPSFLAKAHQSNVGEILLARQALSKSTNPAVRQFAQHMVDDHTKADNELMQLAMQEGIRLANAVPAEFFLSYRIFAELSGTLFDRAYMEANVKAHTDAVSTFVHYANNEADPEQRAYAAATLPSLQQHLNDATQIRDSISAGETGTTGSATPSASES